MRRGLVLVLATAAAGCTAQLSGLGDDLPRDSGSTSDTALGGDTTPPMDSSAAPDFGLGSEPSGDDTTSADGGVDTAPLDTTIDAIEDTISIDTIEGDALAECKPTGDDLLDNGSFENPSEGKDTRTNSKDPSFMPGWKLTASDSGKFWLENGKPTGKLRAKDGAQSICLNSDGSGTSAVEQSFTTVVGARYDLRFWLTDENVAGPSDAVVKVEVGGEVRAFDRKYDNGYVEKSVVFRAFDTDTVVRITDETPSSAWLESPFVDLVSVHACE